MLMNGLDNHTKHAIMLTGSNLADMFEEHSQDGLLSEVGMEEIGECFGDIIEDLRGPVFEALLIELEDRGIEYDIAQFKE